MPQGSLKSVGAGRFVSDNPELKHWRGLVYVGGRNAWEGRPPMAVPVSVRLTFYLRLKGRLPGFQAWGVEPRRANDLDKLVRAIFDAMTAAKVWRDDSLVVEVSARKLRASPPAQPAGVLIEISPAPLDTEIACP